MIPDSILTNVTLIKTLSTEFAGQKITPIPVDIATGFFYSHAEKLYLITNKHVIYGDDFWSEAATPRVSLFSILLHENPKNLTLKRWVDVPLIVDGRNMWLEHLRRVDVVVVLLPPDITPQNYAITPLSVFSPPVAHAGIFTVGYRRDLFDSVIPKPISEIEPIMTAGHLLKTVPAKMYADIETHRGMSGSPVLVESPEGKNELIGIHSGRSSDNMLAVVWSARLIPEIIEQLPR